MMERLEEEVYMPDAGCLSYLAGYISEIGEGHSDGDGMRPVTWLEIECWARLMGIILTPFEYNALHALSVSYVHQFHASNNIACESPYLEIKQENAQKVESKLCSLFAILRSNKDE